MKSSECVLPADIANYDEIIPEDCSMAPCCSCGERMVCNQSTTVCKACESFYR